MFKQVSKQEFEILSRYHPAEVRYYVDMAKLNNKRVKRSAAEKKASRIGGNGNGPITLTSRETREWNGKWNKDKLIALGRSFGNTRQSAAVGTITDRVQRAVDELYHKNVFTQYRRSTLVKKILESTSLKEDQVQPVLTKMITAKWLRIAQDDATSPLDVPKAKEKEQTAAH